MTNKQPCASHGFSPPCRRFTSRRVPEGAAAHGPSGRRSTAGARSGRGAQRPGHEAGVERGQPPGATRPEGRRLAGTKVGEPSWRLGGGGGGAVWRGGKRPQTPNKVSLEFFIPSQSEQLKQLQLCDQELTSHNKNSR